MDYKPTLKSDLEAVLGYLFEDEKEDFIERVKNGEIDLNLLAEEKDAFPDGAETLAAESSLHIFGSVVRIGRQLLDWE